MKASQLIAASALSTAVLGASADAAEIEFLTVLVNDLKANRASYLVYVATATDVPAGVTALAIEVQTYTDDSYTTLLDSGNIDVAAIESFATGLPWYSRIEASLTGAAAGSASATASASASASASGSSVAASTSASASGSASASASGSESASITGASSAASAVSSAASSAASEVSSAASSAASSETSSKASSSAGTSSAASSSAAASSTSSKAAGILNIVDAKLITIGSLIACLL